MCSIFSCFKSFTTELINMEVIYELYETNMFHGSVNMETSVV